MWQAVIHHISCMTAEGLEKRCDGGLMWGGNLMLGCSLSVLRLFRVTCQRIISKYSLSRWVLEAGIRQSTVSIGRKLKIPVLRRNNSWKCENPCTSGVRSNKHTRTLKDYLFISSSFTALPRHTTGPYVGILWNCRWQDRRLRLFSSKDSYTRDCLTVHPCKIPATRVRVFDNLMLVLVECFQPNKTKFPVKIPSQDWGILIRMQLVKAIGKSWAGPEGELYIHCSSQSCTFQSVKLGQKIKRRELFKKNHWWKSDLQCLEYIQN